MAESTNAEVLALTYGAVVRQLLADLHDVEAVNTQLKHMGKNIGMRLVEEFLAKTGTERCSSFAATCKLIAERAFPMFLGVTGSSRPGENSKQCYITLNEMPLAEFVELPPQYQALRYCNLVAGVIEGSLARVNLDVRCDMVRDMLQGASEYEFDLHLQQDVPPEQYPFSETD
jgi:trafficking protein particle complex subunit 3